MTGLSLYHSFLPEVGATYILYVPSLDHSVAMAHRALDSCHAVDQPAELYEGFDGADGIVHVPAHLVDQSWPSWIKLYDERLTSQQTACALGHISFWAKCMTLDRTVVVLEHDAVMRRPYMRHRYPNTIAVLGWDQGPISQLMTGGNNWQVIGGTHGYAIDPLAATRLFSLVLERGIYAPIDIMMRLADVAMIPEEGHVELHRGQSTVPHNG